MQRADRLSSRFHRLTRYSGLLLLFVLLVLSHERAYGQGFVVEGTVLSATEAIALPGVNVIETGTQNGTTTDSDGVFRITVGGPNASLTVSFVGYQAQTIPVNGRSTIVIELEPSLEYLDEVVVTAFGIERQERALGYSVGTVQGERLAEIREPNVANALAGKVPGVVVSKPATGPAGSSRVIIRGNASFEGNNQPLYVVDGIPIDNSNLGAAGMWGGRDAGDGISSINPDDIASMTVLKGPAAAALYGSRAQNGVILITTKTGGRRAGAGVGVEFNSNTTFEDPLVGFPDYQTEYGSGSRGRVPGDLQQALDWGTLSWGARLDGRPVMQFDGVERPYSLVGDRMGDFYRTGLTATNTLAFTGGFDQTTFRLSGSYLTNNSTVPHSGMDRTTLNLRGSSTFGNLTIDARANYVREDVRNRTNLSDAPGNPNWTISQLPPNINPRDLAPGFVPGSALPQEQQFDGNVFSTNPYWAAEYFVADDQRDRLMGHLQAIYQLTDWLSVQARTGQDWYTVRARDAVPFGTAYQPEGSLNERETRILERNTDILVNADRQFSPDFRIMASFGGNRMKREFENLQIGGARFIVPGLLTVSNLREQTPSYGFSEKAINSLYGLAEFSYRDIAFVTVTGRNDWSSTLPIDRNSYFYPSVAASFVFSDAFTVPSWLTFGRLRASWAQVGGDTDPYRLSLAYAMLPFTHDGQPLGVVQQSSIPQSNLKPSSSVGVEGGLDLRLFRGRLGLDVTYYDQRTSDQILSTTVPRTTGYTSIVINAGEMRNRGWELLLTSRPVQTSSFSWDLDFNFGANDNEVVELYGTLDKLDLDQSRSQTAWITAEVGQPYGTIRGYEYVRDEQGRIIVDDDGLPVRGELEILGNGNPDWRGGLMNTLRFRNLMLSALIDISWGGEIFSATNSYAYAAGLHKNTLEGRAECDAAGWPEEGGCWVGPGVRADGSPNNVMVYPQTWFGRVSGIAEEFVYDASYIKLRELQLAYRLPQSWLQQSPVRMATISLVGRNVLLLHSNVPNVDPESNYNNTNAQGLELAGVPQTRSIGLNLSVRF